MRVCVTKIYPHYTGHPHYIKTGHHRGVYIVPNDFTRTISDTRTTWPALYKATCTPIARITTRVCSLIKDSRTGRRLPLELVLQCSLYQGQEGDATRSQPVRGNYKTRLWGGQNPAAVEGKASDHHVYPVVT